MIRTYIIDYQYQMLYIKSTSAHVRGHHYLPHSVLEVLNSKLPVSLVLSSVQDQHLVAYFVQLFEQLVRFNLLINEDQDAALVVVLSE